MNKELLRRIIIFFMGCIIGASVVNLIISSKTIDQNNLILGDEKSYFIESYEDGAVKKEGFQTSDSLFTNYNLTYYRYPIERLSAIRIFVDDEIKMKSNLGRTFYYINFDTAGYLTQFTFFKSGQINYEHDFTHTTRISPNYPVSGN